MFYNTNGQPSRLGATTVPGGGAGGFFLRENTVVAQPGGSGGGAIPSFGNASYAIGGAGTAGYGSSGGAGVDSSAQPHATGGGGGAGGAMPGLGPDFRGATASGNGGLGKTPTLLPLTGAVAKLLGVGESIDETNEAYFASGGGGSLHGDGITTSYSAAQGLAGGGGDGTVVNGSWPSTVTAQSGGSNTGGGGGGAANLNTKISIGGNGGSGVVVLSYINPPEISSVTAGISSLTVTWADQGGVSSGITAYRVDYADASAYESNFGSDPTVSPTWQTASSTISPSATSYTVTNLNPEKKWFVRVAAITAGGVGEFAYPWQKIFETTTPTRVSGQISYSSGLGLSGNNTDLTRTDFSRVRYRLEATYSGTDWYADTHFNKAISSKNTSEVVEDFENLYRLQVPVPTGGTNSQFEIHGNVSDMSVQSNSPLVQNGANLTGRLEIWPWNYGPTPATGLSGGVLGQNYDDGDYFVTNGGFGSFQVHNIGASSGTVFAWNNHEVGPDLGFGSQPYTGAGNWNPDWTYGIAAGASLYPTRTNFSYEAFANLSHQPLDDYSLTLAGNATAGAKTGTAANPVLVIPEDSNYTWEAWVRPESRWTSGTSYQTIFDNAEEGNNYGRSWLYLIDTGSGPYLSGGYYEEGTDGAGVGSPVGHLQYGKWQHVAMSVERGSADGTCSTSITGQLTIRLFVNGVEVNSGGDPSFNGCLNNAGLSVGQNGDFTQAGDLNQFFKGEIDQVKVWDGALTSSQIQTSMQSFGAGSVTNTLRAHFSFNELTLNPADGDTVANLAATGSQYDLQLDSNASANVAANASRTSNSFSLSYDGNGETSGSVSSVTSIRPYANVAVASAGNLSKSNFAFGQWDTKADGSGAEYVPDANYLFTYGNQTLYAEWERSSYNVTYQAGSSGTGANQVDLKLLGQDLALANQATADSWFTRTGYKVIGWSTTDDYTIDYAFGSSYSVDADLTLYPVWGIDQLVVTWDTFVNAGSSSANSSYNETLYYGSNASLIVKSGATLGNITRVVYLKFDYDPNITWNSAALELTVGDQFSATGAAGEYSIDNFAVSIFARDDITDPWSSENSIRWLNAPHLDKSVHPPAFQGSQKIGDFNVPTSDDNGKITGGGRKYIISNGALRDFLNNSDGEVYFFLVRTDSEPGDNLWFASKDNGTYDAPTLRSLSSSDSFLVTYDLNGGAGTAPSNQTFDGVTPISIADGSTFSKGSETFIEWNTERDGSGQSFSSGDAYSDAATLALYAIYGVTQQTVAPSISYSDTVYSPAGTVPPSVITAGHDGAQSFTSSTPSACEVHSTTGVVTIKQAGTCSVAVSFAETAGYAAATATDTFEITKANQNALIWDQSKISYDYLASLNLSTLISGGSGSGAVSFADNNAPNGCRVNGNVLSGGNAGTSCIISVTKGADVNYNSRDLTQTITINKIGQSTLAISNPGTVRFGDTIQLNTTGGSGTGAISFTSSSSSVCTETSSDGEFEFVGVGDCVVSVSKAGDNNYNSQSGSRTISSVKATHTLSFTSTVPANPVVNGQYSVSGVSSTGEASLAPTFTIAAGSSSICSIAGSVVTFTLDGTCEIEGNKAATSHYEAAQTVTQRIVVGQANQSITFAAPTNRTFGDPAFSVSGTSTSGNAVTFTTGSGTTNSACSVTSAGLVVIGAVGTCEIVANSASGNGYAAASPVARTFEVAPDTAGAPFITAVSFGDGQLTATYFAPSYVGGGTISGYRLQAFDGSTLAGTATSCATSGTLSCTVTGLTNGTSYTLKIAAFTEAGLGAVSPASSAKTPAANPEAVSSLTAVQGDTKLVISWRAPSNLGGGVLDSFRVFHREAGGSYPASYTNLTAAQAAAATNNGVTEIEITGLTNGQAYDVKVITVTTANTAQLSSNTAEVSQTPYSVPDAPLTVDVLEVGDDIVITWSQPVFDGGSAISGYSVLLDSVAATCTATSSSSCTIPKSQLTPGTTVAIDVKAENNAGLSTPASTTFTVAQVNSGPSLTITPGAPLDGPGAVLEVVSGQSWVWTKRIAKNQVKVYIKFPEMGANYQINLQKNDGDFVRKMSKTINSTADTDLRVVGEWYYLVRTITLPGEGRYRIEVTQDGRRVTLNGEDRPAVYSYR